MQNWSRKYLFWVSMERQSCLRAETLAFSTGPVTEQSRLDFEAAGRDHRICCEWLSLELDRLGNR